MTSINKVFLVGNIGKDPEIRHTTSGKKIASFSLATSETWKDDKGQRQSKTEWHKVVVFNDNLAGIVEKYVKKGSRVLVEGKLQTRKWADNNGQDRYVTEVVVPQFGGTIATLDPIQKDFEQGGEYDPQAPTNDLDDEIPF